MNTAPQRASRWFVAAVVAAAGLAMAQSAPVDGDPVVVGRRRQFEGFRITNMDIDYELRISRRVDTRKSGGVSLTDTEDEIRNILSFSIDAYAGHPNLLDIDADFRLEYQTNKLDSDSSGRNTDESSLEAFYNIRGLLLGRSNLPITVYSTRDQIRFNREFGGSLDSTQTEHGIGVGFRTKKINGTLRYFHREQEQSDSQSVLDSRIVQDSVGLQATMRINELQSLDLTYSFDTVDESGDRRSGNSFDRNDASLTHNWRFGTDGKNNLRSYLAYFDRAGDFAEDRLRWDERLDLRHTHSLTSLWSTSVETQNRGSQQQDFYAASGQVRHQLFESLTTIVQSGVTRLEIDDGFTSDQASIDGTWAYTKKVPKGRLDATVNLGFDTRDNSERGQPVNITDQSATFTDPAPIILPQRNIVSGSILVTDVFGARIFIEGIDYTIRVLPDRVELRRVIGGAITAGSPVLIDYQIGPEPASTIDTVSTSASVRYGLTEGPLRGVAIHASIRKVDQEIDTTTPSLFVLEDSETLVYGVEFRRRAVYLAAEAEHTDSNISPFDAVRLEARYSRRYGPRGVFSLGANYDTVEFTDDNTESDLLRITGTLDQLIGRELRVRLELAYRQDTSDFAEDTTGFEQELTINWRRRQTSAYASIRNSTLDGDQQNTDFQVFSFGFKREF